MRKALLLCFMVLSGISATMCAQQRSSAGKYRVAVTFDDLPATHGDLAAMKRITLRLTETVRSAKLPAVAFVNESRLFAKGEIDERVALLEMWLDAGAELGNHTFSHVSIDRASLDQYKDEVIRGETVTRRLLEQRGRQLRYFRHPQLRTGPTREYRDALTSWLENRGYTIAPVTIDNNEYIFAAAYRDALMRNDVETMKRIVDAYVPYLESVTAHFENVSRDVAGYPIPQVLLLHANDINADHLDKVLMMYRKRGYRFITLEEALRDPAYRLQEAVSQRGLSWLHRWALAKGMAMRPEPEEPAFVRELFAAARR